MRNRARYGLRCGRLVSSPHSSVLGCSHIVVVGGGGVVAAVLGSNSRKRFPLYPGVRSVSTLVSSLRRVDIMPFSSSSASSPWPPPPHLPSPPQEGVVGIVRMVRTSCGESVLHASSHLLEKETGETAQRALFSFFLSIHSRTVDVNSLIKSYHHNGSNSHPKKSEREVRQKRRKEEGKAYIKSPS